MQPRPIAPTSSPCVPSRRVSIWTSRAHLIRPPAGLESASPPAEVPHERENALPEGLLGRQHDRGPGALRLLRHLLRLRHLHGHRSATPGASSASCRASSCSSPTSIPVISGTFADRYGFKKVLIVSYLAYLPSILLLILTKSFSGIALTMLCIGLAAGIFKPLVSGTVRAVTDKTNKTLGFGIFYAMVNVGGSFGPIVAGQLRAISWDYAFIAAAVAIVVMLLDHDLLLQGAAAGDRGRDARAEAPGHRRRPSPTSSSRPSSSCSASSSGCRSGPSSTSAPSTWTATSTPPALYRGARAASSGPGVRRLPLARGRGRGAAGAGRDDLPHRLHHHAPPGLRLAATSRRSKAAPVVHGRPRGGGRSASSSWATPGVSAAPLVFLGIFLFAVGEMIASPRIQEYITWIAPKEKAGLYMGSNFLAVGIGGVRAASPTRRSTAT